ncbi:MAG: hypothetical protein IJ604_00075 [Prevotella sp.]|nr:hypothetical protein [Prevotella sp.]
MIDLISREFEIAGYRLIGEGLWKHEQFCDYWKVCTVNGITQLEPLQEQVYLELEGLRREQPESEKCTSLLILRNVEQETDKDLRRVIDEENNSYYFKKYVIEFTSQEWDASLEKIPADYQDLGTLLMNTAVFDHLKHHEDSPYFLLYKIAHKLPFCMMRAEKKPYTPNEPISVRDDLKETLDWIEALPDPVNSAPSQEELEAAERVIDELLRKAKDEEHQNQ